MPRSKRNFRDDHLAGLFGQVVLDTDARKDKDANQLQSSIWSLRLKGAALACLLQSGLKATWGALRLKAQVPVIRSSSRMTLHATAPCRGTWGEPTRYHVDVGRPECLLVRVASVDWSKLPRTAQTTVLVNASGQHRVLSKDG